MTSVEIATVGGLDVSRETFAALKQLEALVQRWTPAINLVAKGSVPHLWDRHIDDSAQLFAFCPESATHWADLGAGGGFPGLVIAIIARELRPDLRVTLVESDVRKSVFLQESARALGLNVRILRERIESSPPLFADVVSARALAPLVDLLGYADRHLAPWGIAVYPKGSRHEAELTDARRLWAFDVEIKPSLSEAGAAILMIRNIHRAS